MATIVGSHTIATFTSPVNGTTPIDANTVRGNDNTIQTAYNAHDSDTGIHVQSSTLAARPAAGDAGRKWMTLDGTVLRLWQDTGSSWVEAAAAAFSTARTLWGQTFDGTANVSGSLSSVGDIAMTGALSGATSVSATSMSATTFTGALTGNASTATALQTARTINGVSFNGTADITVTAAAGTLSGTTLASNVVNSSLTSVGTLVNLTVTNPISGSVTGSAGSVAASALTGTTLASGVTASSLTSVGTLTSLAVSGQIGTGNGTVGAPALAASADTNTGIYFPAADTLGFVEGGVESMRLNSAGDLLIGSSTAPSSSSVRLLIAKTGNAFFQLTRTAGTIGGGLIGTIGQNLEFYTHTGGVGSEAYEKRWEINASGHWLANFDTTFDIGASGANRPRDLFLGRNATVAGNLTVDTNTLFVDATNNRVGVGVTSTIAQLCNTTTSDSITGVQPTGFVWRSTDNDWAATIISRPASGLSYALRVHSGGTTASDFPLWISSGASTGTQLLAVNGAGNLGLGVTPSAWATGWRVLEIPSGFLGGASPYIELGQNVFYDGAFKYKTTAAATLYEQISGSHRWYNAASGTAGNAITFTQAMTLGANGNLLIGTTSDSGNRLLVSNNTDISPSNAAAGQVRVEGNGYSFSIALDGSAANLYTNSAARSLAFGTDETNRWLITGSGHLLAGADATYDIGASGATRPRDLFLSRNLTLDGLLTSGNMQVGTVSANLSNVSQGLVGYANNHPTHGNGALIIQSRSSVARPIVFVTGATTGTDRMIVKDGGQVRFVPLAAAPTISVEDGDVYYDSSTNKLRVRAAGAWTDLH